MIISLYDGLYFPQFSFLCIQSEAYVLQTIPKVILPRTKDSAAMITTKMATEAVEDVVVVSGTKDLI